MAQTDCVKYETYGPTDLWNSLWCTKSVKPPIAYISFFCIFKKRPRYESGPYLTQSVTEHFLVLVFVALLHVWLKCLKSIEDIKAVLHSWDLSELVDILLMMQKYCKVNLETKSLIENMAYDKNNEAIQWHMGSTAGTVGGQWVNYEQN